MDAVFKNQLITDNADVSVTRLGIDTKPGSYAITKSGSNYLIDGNAMSASGNAYTSNSGDSSGMVINIASSDVTSANVYYGESLMSLVDTNLTNILAYNGDINTRINNLNQKLTDFSDQKDLLADRMAKVTERYTLNLLLWNIYCRFERNW